VEERRLGRLAATAEPGLEKRRVISARLALRALGAFPGIG